MVRVVVCVKDDGGGGVRPLHSLRLRFSVFAAFRFVSSVLVVIGGSSLQGCVNGVDGGDNAAKEEGKPWKVMVGTSCRHCQHGMTVAVMFESIRI